MKKIYLVLLPILLFSCAPRVTTVIMKSYPVRGAKDSVTVFSLGSTIPSNAEALGKVSVADGGMTVDCKYPIMIKLAKEATRKMGGNGFLITEENLPSFWGSSCHQLAGTSLFLKDSITNDSTKTSFKGEILVNNVSYNKAVLPPQFDLTANIGYGLVLSKTKGLTGNDKKMEETLSKGLTYDFSFHYFFNNSAYGIGIIYSKYNSSYFGLTSLIPNIPLNYGVSISFIAPLFTSKIRFNKSWMLNSEFGLGYIDYKQQISDGNNEISTKGGAFGTKLSIGLDYMVSKNFGIGTDISLIGGRISKLTDSSGKTTELANDQELGLGRLNFTIGARYYFGK